MFKKIISNLYFSPALMEQLNKYNKKIKKELSIRNISLFFSLLTFLLLSLTLLQQNNYTSNSIPAEPVIDNINKSQKIYNISQQKNNNFVANPGDRIAVSLYVSNPTDFIKNIDISDDINDILEYSTIVDNGGGILNETTQKLSWNLTLNNNETQTRTFIIEILKDIPKKSTNGRSFDCIISNSFGNKIDISIKKPLIKQVESYVKSLPKIDSKTNIIFMFIILIINFVLFIRVYQIKKELRIIKKDLILGNIKL